MHVRMSNTHVYFDSYALLPSGQEVLIRRINAHQDVVQSYIQSAGPSFQFRGTLVVCVCSGYPSASHIGVKCRKGQLMLIGIEWSAQDNIPVTPHSITHSDNIVGQPSRLSDERLKTGITELNPASCLSICNTLAPCAYLRTGTDEIRTGLVAQTVEATLASYSMPILPVIRSKMASVDPGTFEEPGTTPEQLKTLAYDRLVPFLLGAVQRLTERVQHLESQLP